MRRLDGVLAQELRLFGLVITVWPLFFIPASFLTSMKFLNWVCSRFLAVAFSSLPSGSEEFLKMRAVVAMAFSSSEPFLRAVREEMHNDVAEVRKSLFPDMGLCSLREPAEHGWKVSLIGTLS